MSITLKYWNGRGLMEIPRMMLAIAGKFPGDYTDGRFDAPPSGLEANLGRMPVLQVGDDSIGQSSAIGYYVAAENGLLGSSTVEAANIIAIYEHLKEMSTAYRTVTAYGNAATPEEENKWFEEGATDVTGTAVREGYSSRYLTWWMGRIENALDTNGYAVGSKLSYADVLLYFFFAEFLRDEDAGEVPQFKREPFGNKARTAAKLANYPKIKASVDAVAANANFQKHLATRGKQGF